jgi:hypothetical protein
MTEESLDRILARCLEEAERSGDIGAVLRDHPEHADELRPLLELASVARRVYADVPAPPGGLAWGRARLLSQARRARSAASAEDQAVSRRERRSRRLPRLTPALIGAAVTTAIVVFGLVSVVRVADGAVPGHPLYGLDRAFEQVQARLTLDPVSAAQLRLRVAEERLREVAQLARGNDQEHLQEGLEGYGDAVVALAQMPGAGRGTDDLAAASALDQVLASHEEQLQAALEEADGGGEGDTLAALWCTGQVAHPVAAGLAQRYAIEADTVMGWLCEDNYGLGEIMHALQTSTAVSGTDVVSDTSPAALLALKTDLGGWGQVWQELGLIGQPDELLTPEPTPTPTPTPQPPGDEDASVTPEKTKTAEPPADEDKPGTRKPTPTPRPPTDEDRPGTPEPTPTPRPPADEDRTATPEKTATPGPLGQEKKPEPSEPTPTPQPPG